MSAENINVSGSGINHYISTSKRQLLYIWNGKINAFSFSILTSAGYDSLPTAFDIHRGTVWVQDARSFDGSRYAFLKAEGWRQFYGQFFDNHFCYQMLSRSPSDIQDFYVNRKWLILIICKFLRLCHLYPSTLILSHLSLDSINAALRRFGLLLSDSKFLAGMSSRSPSINGRVVSLFLHFGKLFIKGQQCTKRDECQNQSSDYASDFQYEPKLFPLVLYGTIALFGTIVFGYFYWQAHYCFKFSLGLLLSLAGFGLLIFCYGFGMFLYCLMNSLEPRTEVIGFRHANNVPHKYPLTSLDIIGFHNLKTSWTSSKVSSDIGIIVTAKVPLNSISQRLRVGYIARKINDVHLFLNEVHILRQEKIGWHWGMPREGCVSGKCDRNNFLWYRTNIEDGHLTISTDKGPSEYNEVKGRGVSIIEGSNNDVVIDVRSWIGSKMNIPNIDIGTFADFLQREGFLGIYGANFRGLRSLCRYCQLSKIGNGKAFGLVDTTSNVDQSLIHGLELLPEDINRDSSNCNKQESTPKHKSIFKRYVPEIFPKLLYALGRGLACVICACFLFVALLLLNTRHDVVGIVSCFLLITGGIFLFHVAVNLIDLLEISVPQKYCLTNVNYRGTVIAIGRTNMANVLDSKKQVAIISALAEGSGIRQIERMTGVHRDTIMRLGVRTGQGCARLLDHKMRGLTCHQLQFDELWGFVGKKERHVRPDDDPQFGDVWTFCAIDRDTKLVPSFKVGKRDLATANAFVADVASRVKNRVQISSDALKAYVDAIEMNFGADVDFAQIVKTYIHEDSANAERKYSASEIVLTEKKSITGFPNMRLASTSHVERLNGTTRLHMRRLTRLTYAFSKKLENFDAAVALHFAYYNFVKRHNTLRCTPAMAAGIERDFWTVENLVEAAA